MDLSLFSRLSLKLLPVITPLIVKRLVNTLLSRFYFTNRKTNLLALNNFREYNIYLFLNFYFSYLLGLLSVLVKLSKSIIAITSKSN